MPPTSLLLLVPFALATTAAGACTASDTPITTPANQPCKLSASPLAGKHFRVRTVKFLPFYSDNATSSVNLDLLQELARRGDFTYELSAGTGGGEDWGAAEAELLDGTADLMVGDFFARRSVSFSVVCFYGVIF